MMKDRLNPLNDYLFLKVMGEKGDEEQLCAFPNAVLCREGQAAIESVEIIENKTILADVIGDKTSILDVRAGFLAGRRKVGVEVQLRNMGDMGRRSLFYWSREFSRGMKAGQDYQDSPNVITINILDYEFLPQVPKFHPSFHIREDTHPEVLLTDALEIHFIDMVKFRRLEEKDIRNDALHRWLTWFDQNSPKPLVEEVINMDSGIQKAEKKMAYVSSDKEALRVYQMREMALSDWTSGLNHARREGIRKGRREGMEKGIQKGMEKGIQKVAAQMKKRGIAFDQIADVTGLSLEDIAAL
jgi:predicted transposase/invertase (TIGR01784 family)